MESRGTGTVTIRGTAAGETQSGPTITSSGSHGIHVHKSGSSATAGNISITTTGGSITAGTGTSHGIHVQDHSGYTGAVTIDNAADVTASGGRGINVSRLGSGSISVTVGAGASVTGSAAGVYVANGGSGLMVARKYTPGYGVGIAPGGNPGDPDELVAAMHGEGGSAVALRNQLVTVRGTVTGGTSTAAVHLTGGRGVLVLEGGSVRVGSSGSGIVADGPALGVHRRRGEGRGGRHRSGVFERRRQRHGGAERAGAGQRRQLRHPGRPGRAGHGDPGRPRPVPGHRRRGDRAGGGRLWGRRGRRPSPLGPERRAHRLLRDAGFRPRRPGPQRASRAVGVGVDALALLRGGGGWALPDVRGVAFDAAGAERAAVPGGAGIGAARRAGRLGAGGGVAGRMAGEEGGDGREARLRPRLGRGARGHGLRAAGGPAGGVLDARAPGQGGDAGRGRGRDGRGGGGPPLGGSRTSTWTRRRRRRATTSASIRTRKASC